MLIFNFSKCISSSSSSCRVYSSLPSFIIDCGPIAHGTRFLTQREGPKSKLLHHFASHHIIAYEKLMRLPQCVYGMLHPSLCPQVSGYRHAYKYNINSLVWFSIFGTCSFLSLSLSVIRLHAQQPTHTHTHRRSDESSYETMMDYSGFQRTSMFI